MYIDLFNIVSNALFGAVALTGWQEMFVTVIASAGTLFVFCVPFMIVWKLICLIVGR